MTQTYSLSEIIDRAIENRLFDIHTCFPGKVQSYNSSQQTADVIPLVKSPAKTPEGLVSESLPILVGVPVMFPSSGAFSITFPINPGDRVMVFISEFNLDEWKSKGENSLGDIRKFTLNGAVAYPGVRPLTQPLQTNATAMTLQGNVNLGTTTAAEAMVLGNVLLAKLGELIVSLNTHTHTGNSGAPTSPPITPASAIGNDILSTRHKLDS